MPLTCRSTTNTPATASRRARWSVRQAMTGFSPNEASREMGHLAHSRPNGPRTMVRTPGGPPTSGAEVYHGQTVTCGQPAGDQRAMARFGIALDAKKRRNPVRWHLRDDRCQIDAVEDLLDVTLAVCRRQHHTRSLADAEPVVLFVLEVAQLGGRCEL